MYERPAAGVLEYCWGNRADGGGDPFQNLQLRFASIRRRYILCTYKYYTFIYAYVCIYWEYVSTRLEFSPVIGHRRRLAHTVAKFCFFSVPMTENNNNSNNNEWVIYIYIHMYVILYWIHDVFIVNRSGSRIYIRQLDGKKKNERRKKRPVRVYSDVSLK